MMKKLLSTTAIVLCLNLTAIAAAHEGYKAPFEDALSNLPEQKAEAFRNTMKQTHDKNAALYDQMKKLHDDLYTITTAEKFDKKAYIAKNKELQAVYAKMNATRGAAMGTALSNLSQDERKTVADAMRDMHKHHWHGKKDGDATKQGGDERPADGAQ